MLQRISPQANPEYDAYFKVRFPYDARREFVWREVCHFLQKRYVPEDSRILDMGAGYCSFINNVRGREKHALDQSGLIEEYANADVVTHVQSCTALDTFPDGSFDVVFASNLFEHLTREDLWQTLRGLRRLLSPAGRLIVLQPNFACCPREYFHDYTHLQIFTHESLADVVMASGFDVKAVWPRFLPVNMKSRLALKLPLLHLITRLYLHLPFKPQAGQMLVVADKAEAPERG
jgi:SAM-dependent methyltransferase